MRRLRLFDPPVRNPSRHYDGNARSYRKRGNNKPKRPLRFDVTTGRAGGKEYRRRDDGCQNPPEGTPTANPISRAIKLLLAGQVRTLEQVQ